ncbi:STAS domain-containing protein [Sphingomonas sp. 2R-10]|uniref:STAS domain-containing protein n=1 Tax=Sphingomonas sp. 2R-10 TaxID=3045148 RepID=UPI0024BB3664|nr:STAS domain-containing protein [Sphingomonas sp. 2R-10]MDJ0276252.1 STAS domain-containing protein [Sphingomonas sp. 2R-10]
MTAAITVPSTLSMTTIGAFADELRALPLDRDVVLDVADLSASDLSVLQLIESLRAETRLQGGTVRLAAPAGDTLTTLLRRAGFVDAQDPENNIFWFHGVPLQ